MKKIILEGCNGEWAQKRYLPFLTEKMLKENFELWAIDIDPRIKLSDSKLVELWKTAQSKNKAHYLDKIKNKKSYERLSDADYVFIVTPDRFHCEIAEFWLERLERHGKIFIEKPLDVSVHKARKLKEKIGDRDIVYGFNHYSSRVHTFLQNKTAYLKEIGQIKKIEFHILESYGIFENRVETLSEGVIFDLSSKVFPLIGTVLDLKSLSSEVRVEEVKAAKYIDAPILEETFAWVKSRSGTVELEIVVGKGIGRSNEKFMNIFGSGGQIKINFSEYKFSIFDSQNCRKKHGNLNHRDVESFLEEILQGKEPLSVSGVLSFGEAFETLKVLDDIKKRIKKVSKYQKNESIGEILKKLY